ncbi:hypothetical protein BJQ94_16460 [Cryobacterium sp. SO2]|uniref:hypothetical protein n=1 Tax=Cryobacterium sp. SO2 TaxID=1897060 RepID=UPI00223E6FF4|nr:hypothetical protein [Cryobacterium sp. SO2]WEO76928.1 hypothetical protein BJQ94_16460 [Cryobacterium sp. SO2]
MTAWLGEWNTLRRSAVIVAGLLLTAPAVLWVATIPPVYSARVGVVLLAPVSLEPNGYAQTSEALVDLAGVVARQIRDSGETVRADAVSPDVTLASQGVHEGYVVRHANLGGQWEYEFTDPILDVQAVAATSGEASALADAAVAQIQTVLASMQDEQSVPEGARVRMTLNPDAIQVREEGGSRLRAATATGLIGLLVTAALLGAAGQPRRHLPRLPPDLSRRTAPTARALS